MSKVQKPIERMLAENERLRLQNADLLAALRPFAALWLRALEMAPDDKPIWQLGEAVITVGDVKAARAAIAKAEAADD